MSEEGWANNKVNVSDKINPDQYLDIAIKGIILLPNELMQKENNFDVNKYLRMKFILTEQLESIAIAMRKIKPMKQIYDVDSLNENEKALRDCLIDYFRKSNVDLGAGAISKSDSIMRYILEGSYPTKISLMREKLESDVKSGKLTKEIAEAQLANFKLQLVISSVNNSKVRLVDIDG